MRMGKTPYRAALEAADEIGLAVIAITATIIAIFAPVCFMGGIAGQYFKQFGLTIAAAVFMSLLVARLITPLLAAYFLRDHGPEDTREGLVMRGYLRLVAGSVRHKFVTLVVGLACFRRLDRLDRPAALGLPAQARTQPAPSSRSNCRRAPSSPRPTAVTDELVAQDPRPARGAQSVFVDGGRQLPGKKEIRLATLTVNLTPKNTAPPHAGGGRDRDRRDPARAARHPLLVVRDSGQRDLALMLAGPDQAVVADVVAASLQREMAQRAPPRQRDLDRTARPHRDPHPPEGRDRGRSRRLDRSSSRETVRVGTIGDIGANLAKFNAEDRQVPIRVQLPERLAGRPVRAARRSRSR